MKNSAFVRLFRFFPKLFAAGLIYSAALVGLCALSWLLAIAIGFNNIIMIGLGIIPSTPLLAGLVMIIRKIAVEKKDVPLLKTFFEAVKDNLKLFLFHGAVIYLIVACAVFAVLYYGVLAGTSPIYASLLTFYLLFTAVLVVVMFYVPIMSVTYELRLRDIYKNAFILVLGKIQRNLIALGIILAFSAAAFFSVLYAEGVIKIVLASVTAALWPLLFNYTAISVTAKGLQDAVGSFTAPTPEEEPAEHSADEAEAVENADKESDYVFVNGRMIKVEKK